MSCHKVVPVSKDCNLPDTPTDSIKQLVTLLYGLRKERVVYRVNIQKLVQREDASIELSIPRKVPNHKRCVKVAQRV